MPSPIANFISSLLNSQNRGQRNAQSNAQSGAGSLPPLAPDTRREIYTILASNVTEEAFGHLNIIDGRIYCCSGITNGILQEAAGDVHLGPHANALTEVRAVGDQAQPYLIPETANSQRQSARLYCQGTAGDKLVLFFRA